MNALWTDSVTKDNSPAPDLTSVKISNSLTVPREAITVFCHYLSTIKGHNPPSPPRWSLDGILTSINFIFTGTPDLTMEQLELVLGFANQPGEVEKLPVLAASVDKKLLARLEYFYFKGTHEKFKR